MAKFTTTMTTSNGITSLNNASRKTTIKRGLIALAKNQRKVAANLNDVAGFLFSHSIDDYTEMEVTTALNELKVSGWLQDAQ